MTIFIKEGSSPPVPGVSFPGVEGIVPRCRTHRSSVPDTSFLGAEQTEVVRCWQRMVYINDKNAGYW